MKLLSFVSIFALSINISTAFPTINTDAPSHSSQQPQCVKRRRSSNFGSHVGSIIFPSSPAFDSLLSSYNNNIFDDMPNDVLDLLALHSRNDQDIKNLALLSKGFHSAPTVMVIRNIRHFCFVTGRQMHPKLKLLRPPSRECADSIIASNGKFLIQTIKMESVVMTLDGAESIVLIIRRTKLRHLILFECTLTTTIIAVISNAITQSMLTSLDIGFSKIGSEGAKAIAAVLPQSQLKSLNLECSNIGSEGARAIAAVIARSKLISLNLRLCQIRDDGAIAIANALPQSELTFLDVGFNHIHQDGAQEIALVLSQSKLTSLNLDGNLIGKEGAKAIAAGLPRSSLTSLNLQSNIFGDEGAKAIAAVLPLTKLTSLSLQWNSIGYEGAKAIAAVTAESSLLFLFLEGNHNSAEGAEAITYSV